MSYCPGCNKYLPARWHKDVLVGSFECYRRDSGSDRLSAEAGEKMEYESMIRLRQAREADWEAIGWLASDAVQEGDHADWDAKWVEARRTFEGDQVQAVAEMAGAIVGYCAIERRPDDPAATFRVFIVTDWRQSNRAVHEALLNHAERMLREHRAQRAWMRELTGDTRLLDFVQRHGYAISKRYEYAGREMVNLTRRLEPSGASG